MTELEENLRLKQRVKELESQNVKHMDEKSKWRNVAKGLLEEKKSWLGVCEKMKENYRRLKIQRSELWEEKVGLKNEVAELREQVEDKETYPEEDLNLIKPFLKQELRGES